MDGRNGHGPPPVSLIRRFDGGRAMRRTGEFVQDLHSFYSVIGKPVGGTAILFAAERLMRAAAEAAHEGAVGTLP